MKFISKPAIKNEKENQEELGNISELWQFTLSAIEEDQAFYYRDFLILKLESKKGDEDNQITIYSDEYKIGNLKTFINELTELEEAKLAWLMQTMTIKNAVEELCNEKCPIEIRIGTKKENTEMSAKDILGNKNYDDLKLFLGETSFNGFVEFLFNQRDMFSNYFDFEYNKQNYTVILFP